MQNFLDANCTAQQGGTSRQYSLIAAIDEKNLVFLPVLRLGCDPRVVVARAVRSTDTRPTPIYFPVPHQAG